MMIALYAIGGLIALIFLLMLLMPGKYAVEKSITINKPVAEVFANVADYNKYRIWNPWSKMEPTATFSITGTIATVGHKFNWEGKKIGTGFLEIRGIKVNQSIDGHLEFLKPWQATANDTWKFESLGSNTKVTWTNDGPLPFGMARLMGPMITKNLNKQFDEGLTNLKSLCEN